MADKVFPNEMRFAVKSPDVKKAFLLEVEPFRGNHCENCGGHGFLYAFLATGGPFENSPSNGVAKWADGKWWKGATFSFQCPKCGGQSWDKWKITQETAS